MKNKGYRVIPQMFDVKPVNQDGNLDLERIKALNRIIRLEKMKMRASALNLKLEPSPKKQNLVQKKYQPVKLVRPKLIQFNRFVNSYRDEIPAVIKSNYQRPLPTQTFSDIERGTFTSRERLGPSSHRLAEFSPAKETKPEAPAPQCNPAVCPTVIKTSFKSDFVFDGDALQAKPESIGQDPFEHDKFDSFFSKSRLATTEKIDHRLAWPEKNKAEKTKKTPRFSLGKLLLLNYNKLSKSLNPADGLGFGFVRPAMNFALALFIATVGLSLSVYVSRGFQVKNQIEVKGAKALGYLAEAKVDLENKDYSDANSKFENAKEEFEQAQNQLDGLGGELLNIFSKLPYLSKISSGRNVIEAGQKLTQAAQQVSQVIEILSEIKNPLDDSFNQGDKSLLDLFVQVHEKVLAAKQSMDEAQKSIDLINPEDLPEQYREKFEKIKQALPLVIEAIDGFEQNYQIFLDILGHNGPRKYLFLFQNNQEMRATGGFIGSYGILDISNGHIRNIFVDGIFNPDGQLKEKVVPPTPIQKISAVWTMHDSNWFPDFPTSAQKAAWFYEKTGGPTVDGVIALTPTVLQKLLEISGPIDMPEYETTVDAENFIEKTQYEVEVDYDKEQNKPKQFIADLAPKILDNVFSLRDPKKISQLAAILSDSLKQKHILIYANNYDLQKLISRQGWSGEVKQTSKDYLMVVNSNINGFKTDGVIDEGIEHQAQIQPDGSVIDTVKIKRTHNGGDTPYDWWNKVNADYMRLYVPQGSQLLEVSGQTREFNQPPLDYNQLGFRHDPQVDQEERNLKVDEDSGTRIYDENNKTVFANWVYVSPKESVEIEYKYLLPFKVDLDQNKDRSGSYSLLVQKQSGSIGSSFSTEIDSMENAQLIWKYPESGEIAGNVSKFSDQLSQDRFYGLVFQKTDQN